MMKKLVDKVGTVNRNMISSRKPLYVQCIIDKATLQLDPSLLTDEFKEFAEELKCPICLNLVIEPRECKTCNQIFCSNCLETWFKSPAVVRSNQIGFFGTSNATSSCPMKCPKFEESISKKLANMISKIKIKCPNNTNGCPNVVQFNDIFSHLKECPMNEFKCNGCGLKGKLQEIQIHTNLCELIPEVCKLCSKEFIRARLQEHQQECPFRVINCELCNSEMKLLDLKNHTREDCSLKIIQNYENLLNQKNIVKKVFLNVFISQILQFNQTTIKNINDSIVERSSLYEFFYHNNRKEFQASKGILTIIEVIEEVTFSSVEIKIMDFPQQLCSNSTTLKIFSSLIGKDWTQVGEKVLTTNKTNYEAGDVFQCKPSKAKFILINCTRPFRLLKFKFLA